MSSATRRSLSAISDSAEGSEVENPHARASVVAPKMKSASGQAVAAFTVADALVEALTELGVEHAFGIIGGAIAPFCKALSHSSLRLIHARHETGAALAAMEASLVTGKLSVVFVTTGPGLANSYTGMVMARTEGAKVLLVTGCTSAAQRGRGAFQETGGMTSALMPLFTSGAVFHHAALVEDPLELDAFIARLASGVARPNGFVAHLGLPIAVQTARCSERTPRLRSASPPVCDAETVLRSVSLLASEPFVIWAGFGARHAGPAVRALAELTGTRVMATPRAKGVMPENHPLYLGVTGHGGHATVEETLKRERPARALVLGSRLGEMVSFWSPELVPREGFVHVDLDPNVFGSAYPRVPTTGVQAEIGAFVEALITAWPSHSRSSRPPAVPTELFPALEARARGPVRPSFLMQVVQRDIVEQSEASVIVEAGNALALGNHYLRFQSPGRYRASTCFAAMGHASAGVLGAALGHQGKAVAIVGDGALLMQNEINTAVNYGLPAVWIVLNDARYGMIAQGMQSIGWEPFATDFPRTDFVAIARAMGADGLRVEHEGELEAALKAGLAARGPFVIDVIIDPNEIVPSGRRNQSLEAQGVNAAPKTVDEGAPKRP